ncbi:MAG: hypothetical protein ACU84J_09165, partial [Gammaproteobacteria bacterium]
MNLNTRILFILAALFSAAALAPSPAYAKFWGAKRAFCATCCQQMSPDGTNLNEPCPEKTTNSFVSNTEGLLGDSYTVVSATGANGEGLELSLRYASYNANGENGTLDSALGFGWSHSYNIFLFTQNRDVFKMSPGGIITKYQRSGRSGSLTAITGTQQTVNVNPDGSIEITNRQGRATYRFEQIPGNPIRIAAVEPLMLKTITDRNGNVTQLTYDINGLLEQVDDAYGRQIKFEYDSTKHLIKITDPLGRATQLQYGGYNNLTKIVDPLGNTVQYAYDVRHQIVRKTDQNGHQWHYSYNAGGHPIAVTDQAGDPVLSLTNPDDWATNDTDLAVQKLRTYIPSVTTLTDGRGNPWQYFYNSDGQITKMVAPDGAETTYTYDPVTLNMASMTDANLHTTQYQYDAFGNLTKQIDDDGNEIRYQYANPFNFVTQMAYFASGASTPHSVTTYEYDALGNRTKEIRDVGGLELQTDWTYYVSGASEPGNPSGVKGLMKTEEVHNGTIVQITQYEYDAFGNRNKVTDPENNETVYVYDMIGNRTKMIDANGHEWNYAYDVLYRLIQETDSLGFLSKYDYDGVGNRIEMLKQVALDNSLPPQVTQYQYDIRDRLIKESRDPADLNLITAYSYDNNDNRKTVTDPRQKTTTFDYDVQNRLSKVTDALVNITETRYDPVGNRICTIDANGHYTFFEY